MLHLPISQGEFTPTNLTFSASLGICSAHQLPLRITGILHRHLLRSPSRVVISTTHQVLVLPCPTDKSVCTWTLLAQTDFEDHPL
ncbi:MAG: hypothetical protein AAFX01_13900 [Cyanobacteria bacterium J06638_28]